MKGRTLTHDDLVCVAKYLIRYAGAMPGQALKRLMDIELFRNNYSKCTIYNLCRGTRRLLKDGHKIETMPIELSNIILELATKAETPEQTIAKKKETNKLDIFHKKLAEYTKMDNYIQIINEEYAEKIRLIEHEKANEHRTAVRLRDMIFQELEELRLELMKEKVLGE